MKKNELSIEINKPVSEVFEFIINPQNTAKWIDSILMQESNSWPIKLGTFYRNRTEVPGMRDHAELNEYQVVKFEPNKVFELRQKDGPYHILYTHTSLGENKTKLTYSEWMEEGELTNPFTQNTLNKLKAVMERTQKERPNSERRLMVELTRFKVKKGKSQQVTEHIKKHNDNMAAHMTTLIDEKMYIESIFREINGEDEYLYWFSIQGEGASHLLQSKHKVDEESANFAKECFDREAPDGRTDMKLEVSMIRDELRKVMKDL